MELQWQRKYLGKNNQQVFQSRDICRPTHRRFKCIVYKTNKAHYKILTIYECFAKLSMIIGCNLWMICLELNWFFFAIRVECCNFLNLYGPKTFLIKDSASENLRKFDAFSGVEKDRNKCRLLQKFWIYLPSWRFIMSSLVIVKT